MEEGYIKFTCDWKRSRLTANISELIAARNRVFDMGLIGTYPDGIGFGNISIREKKFIISGSATGGVARAGQQHFTRVLDYDFDKNWLLCEGPAKASSESLTHAAVYESDPNINAVIHVHSKEMWERLKGRVPAAREDISYGTPEMGYEVKRLFSETDVAKKGVFIMLGHEEGVVVFGRNLDLAESTLKSLF
ncbi:MAG: class II aldolase/adducin family protein [Nanoarchaeota archaeon]|nr:class II aldolase/adducin family protein [Nanoarchaeota archaeon]